MKNPRNVRSMTTDGAHNLGDQSTEAFEHLLVPNRSRRFTAFDKRSLGALREHLDGWIGCATATQFV